MLAQRVQIQTNGRRYRPYVERCAFEGFLVWWAGKTQPVSIPDAVVADPEAHYEYTHGGAAYRALVDRLHKRWRTGE